MTNKIQVKLILELRDKNMSRNSIAQIRGMSRNSVSEVFKIADQKGITFKDVRDKNPEAVYLLFFPERHNIESLYEMPDYDYVHSELKRIGVTTYSLVSSLRSVIYKFSLILQQIKIF